jgi:hypothetical protein
MGKYGMCNQPYDKHRVAPNKIFEVTVEKECTTAWV